MFDGIAAIHRIKLIQICVAGIQVRNVLCFPIGCEEDSQSFPQSALRVGEVYRFVNLMGEAMIHHIS